jgi:hypothetical protein
MAKQVCLVAINGGIVCQDNGGSVKGFFRQKGRQNQVWAIEHGENKNQVAFRNLQTGGWLRNDSASRSAPTRTGNKQWWTLHEGHAPGSCWIQCNDYPNMYLCNSCGNRKDDNVIWSWNYVVKWTYTMLWYIQASDGNLTPAPSGGEKQDEAIKKAVSEKEEKIRQLEARVKELEEEKRKQGDSASAIEAERDEGISVSLTVRWGRGVG